MQLCIYSSPLHGQDVTIFKWSFISLNSEFYFSKTLCHAKVKELSLPYHLAIVGERIIGFIHFPRVLRLCEMQTASSKIWTRVTVSISFDNDCNASVWNYSHGNPTNLWVIGNIYTSVNLKNKLSGWIILQPTSGDCVYMFTQLFHLG